MRRLFTVVLVACSGQAAPPADWPVSPVAAPRIVDATVDAAGANVGAACGSSQPCGPALTCDLGMPGGTCSASCEKPGTSCGDGTCVEYPTFDACRASCRTTADCRADEGYACDPVWRGCVLANSPTIAPRACPPPPGFGRDPLFAPPTPLSVGGEVVATITDDGGLVAISERRDRSGLDIARLDANGRLEAAIAPITDHHAPALARDGATLLLAAAAPGQISIATSTDRGRTWSPPKPIVDLECATAVDCAQPSLVVGSDARRERVAYLAYASGGGLRVRASRDGGKTFGPAVTALPGVRGSLAVSGDGTLHVAALRGSPRGAYGAGDHEILWTTSVDGGRSFARPRRVSRDGELIPFYFGTPRIEVDPARKWMYLAYTRGGRDGTWDLVIAATKDLGKTWTRRTIGDDPPCGTYLSPQLALDPKSGGLHVSWYDSRGPRITHGLCADGLRWCRQLGRINDVPFAGLSLARHARTAATEAHALLVDPQRRQLHAVWSQAVAEDAAQIFHARAKLPQRW